LPWFSHQLVTYYHSQAKLENFFHQTFVSLKGRAVDKEKEEKETKRKEVMLETNVREKVLKNTHCGIKESILYLNYIINK